MKRSRTSRVIAPTCPGSSSGQHIALITLLPSLHAHAPSSRHSPVPSTLKSRTPRSSPVENSSPVAHCSPCARSTAVLMISPKSASSCEHPRSAMVMLDYSDVPIFISRKKQPSCWDSSKRKIHQSWHKRRNTQAPVQRIQKPTPNRTLCLSARLPPWQTEVYIRIYSLRIKRDNQARSHRTSTSAELGFS